jgi:zinc/manganese transport system substrate-binding protein
MLYLLITFNHLRNLEMALGRKSTIIIAMVAVACILIVAGISAVLSSSNNANATTGKIKVVASENFWGSLVSQIGGTYVEVSCIVSDPNADPHEYESTTSDAKEFATANYIIINGAGYDSWAENLISSGIRSDCKVLNVGDLIGVKEGENPHFWYSPTCVNQAVKEMEEDLLTIDPVHTNYYEQQYANLTLALKGYQDICSEISEKYNGTKIAGSAEVVEYIAEATDLDLITSTDFMEAICESYDPPAASIAEFQEQLKSGTVSVLIYSSQTVTPITENMKALAIEEDIPIVYVTHTMPIGMTFQEWMHSEYGDLEDALSS